MFSKNASRFSKIFLKKVVSRSLSTTKSFDIFPVFRLTFRSNAVHGPFSGQKTVQKHCLLRT